MSEYRADLIDAANAMIDRAGPSHEVPLQHADDAVWRALHDAGLPRWECRKNRVEAVEAFRRARNRECPLSSRCRNTDRGARCVRPPGLLPKPV